MVARFKINAKAYTAIDEIHLNCSVYNRLPLKEKPKHDLHIDYPQNNKLGVIDLTDLHALLCSKENPLFLCNIKKFSSKYAWSYIIKDKTAASVLLSLKQALESNVKAPKSI